MVILGLGTNNGDRLAQLRQALKALQHIPHFSIKKISPVYHSDALLPEQAPSGWNLPFLNIAIRCETTLEPLTLLTHLQQIEQQLGRTPTERWAPRCIDIDILAWDNLVLQQEHLTIPHPGLLTRPFALWPLADIVPFWQIPSLQKTAAEYVEAWGSRFTGEAPLHTRQLYQRIETPQLVGAINITPDSFSDGGLFLNVDAAIQQAEQLVIAGAEILDLGAESTSPRAQPIDAAIEWQRLEPVLLAINQIKNRFIIPPRISIDTRHALTAQKALTAGADWINDVSGLDDPAMRDIIAQTQTECVVMHHLAIP
ncbi:MAG TPA: 2-amino-4-hydroxy-6-hydroxymethyldihydropteridine diphosphokinase, partial [Gammaproteobacteria bacterium]|nr:2-amino-4-hydroxy-6-hydroxymethyldihydropteridine diphosphokinase [Gammaproteobacteria bacterium]